MSIRTKYLTRIYLRYFHYSFKYLFVSLNRNSRKDWIKNKMFLKFSIANLRKTIYSTVSSIKKADSGPEPNTISLTHPYGYVSLRIKLGHCEILHIRIRNTKQIILYLVGGERNYLYQITSSVIKWWNLIVDLKLYLCQS